MDSSNAVALAAMLKEGNRVAAAFKQTEDDMEGKWWGGLVGPVSNDGAIYCIGYDDGELKCHERIELAEMLAQKKLKPLGLTSMQGMISDEVVPQAARDFCYTKVGNKRVPVGVLIGDGKDVLCGQPLFHAHVVSIEVTDKFESRGLRQGRRYACENVPFTMYASVLTASSCLVCSCLQLKIERRH